MQWRKEYGGLSVMDVTLALVDEDWSTLQVKRIDQDVDYEPPGNVKRD